MGAYLIDSHAHIGLIEDLEAEIEEAGSAGVIAVIAVGSDYESNLRVLEISEKHKAFVYPALGQHPWELERVGIRQVEGNLRLIEENIARAVGVGEIGLDYDKRVKVDKGRQQGVFREVLGLARRYGKPALIHSRYAWKDCFDLAAEVGVERAIFHWFTGPSSVLREIIAAGYFISATPATEYHGEHRRTVKEAPLGKLLLETDCPVEYGRGIRYRSRLVDLIRSLRAVAALKEVDEGIIARETTRNARALFSLGAATEEER